MNCPIKILVGVVLAFLTADVALSAPSRDSRSTLAGATAKANRSKSGKIAKRRFLRRDGHDLLSRSQMKELRVGTHRMVAVEGYVLFAKLQRGKIAGISVKTPKGRLTVLRLDLSPPNEERDTDEEEDPVDGLVPTGRISFVYRDGDVEITLFFPVESLTPDLGGPDGTERLG